MSQAGTFTLGTVAGLRTSLPDCVWEKFLAPAPGPGVAEEVAAPEAAWEVARFAGSAALTGEQVWVDDHLSAEAGAAADPWTGGRHRPGASSGQRGVRSAVTECHLSPSDRGTGFQLVHVATGVTTRICSREA